MPIVYLFVTDTLADWEPSYVLAELHSGRYLKDPLLKYTVIPCGLTMDPVRTMGGIRITPEEIISNIQPVRGDLLLLPGADTWLDPAKKPCLEKVRGILESDTTVAAICGATLALANAGMLDKRPHTSNDLMALKMCCPAYRGEPYYLSEPAVTDGNLITAGGLAPAEFAYHIFKKLNVMTPATLEAWYSLLTTRKPEFYFQLMESRGSSGR